MSFVVIRTSGTPRLIGVNFRFLDDEWTSGFNLARQSEVFDLIERAGWQSIQADAVLRGIDYPLERGDQANFVCLATDNLEH
jgi:hypothetical protein